MSTASHHSDSHYIHGTSPEEQARLSLLNDLLNKACLKEMKLNAEQKILDIGSGLGQFTRLMAKTALQKPFVLGIERDQAQLRQAMDFARSSKEEELVVFKQGDATQLSKSAESWLIGMNLGDNRICLIGIGNVVSNAGLNTFL